MAALTTAQKWERLEWAVRMLAQDAETQIALHPDFADITVEMDLDLQGAIMALENSGLRKELLAIPELARVNALFARLGQKENDALWEIEGLRTASVWAEMRVAAAALIQQMGWSSAPPPTDHVIYVHQPEK